jgi:hypothetical protein
MFDFMAQVKKIAKKKACLELLVVRESESNLEQVLKESALEELVTETLESKHVGQVHHRNLFKC